MKYIHTFTYKNYIVAVIYRNDDDSESAAMHVCTKWDRVRVEKCEDLQHLEN